MSCLYITITTKCWEFLTFVKLFIKIPFFPYLKILYKIVKHWLDWPWIECNANIIYALFDRRLLLANTRGFLLCCLNTVVITQCSQCAFAFASATASAELLDISKNAVKKGGKTKQSIQKPNGYCPWIPIKLGEREKERGYKGTIISFIYWRGERFHLKLVSSLKWKEIKRNLIQIFILCKNMKILWELSQFWRFQFELEFWDLTEDIYHSISDKFQDYSIWQYYRKSVKQVVKRW